MYELGFTGTPIIQKRKLRPREQGSWTEMTLWGSRAL